MILPFDGKALTETGIKSMEAGIPVVNLDRVFDSPRASRAWIGGDNYGMGAAAGRYVAEQMKAKDVTNPVIAEIQGIANLPLTQDRSRGFADALKAAGFKVSNQVSAAVHGRVRAAGDGQPAAGRTARSTRSGTTTTTRVSASSRRSTRPGATSSSWSAAPDRKNVMDAIKADNSVLKATVTYPPSMASSAIKLARLIAQGKGMSDLVEPDVPASITLASAIVTKENVDQYLPLAFSPERALMAA